MSATPVAARSAILFTGGGGLLGEEMQGLLPEAQYPSSGELDVASWKSVDAYGKAHEIDLIVHAAAFTSPPRIDEDPLKALEANIIGTANVVRLCIARGCRLIYVSTDYVFKGDRGPYAEDDAVSPVNKYAWSKLGGECAARLYDRSLIVRTSFGPNEFPFAKAFVDQWTSREPVAVVARKLAALMERDVTGVVHVGGSRRTVYEYATEQDSSRSVGKLSVRDVTFAVPVDTSLDCRRFEEIMAGDDGG